MQQTSNVGQHVSFWTASQTWTALRALGRARSWRTGLAKLSGGSLDHLVEQWHNQFDLPNRARISPATTC
jgi:hypothetical protein